MFSSSRTFGLWDVLISHSQVLLRSAKDETDPDSRNIDLIFSGVFYVQLMTTLRGVEIRQMEQAAAEVVIEEIGGMLYPGNHVFALLSGGRRYLVGAAVFRVEENDLHPMMTSLAAPHAAE